MPSEEEPTNHTKASTKSTGEVTHLLASPAALPLHSRLLLIHTRSASALIGRSLWPSQPITSQAVLLRSWENYPWGDQDYDWSLHRKVLILNFSSWRGRGHCLDFI